MQEIIGTIAATLTTLSFLPQTIKVIKTRHTKDISLLMYVLLVVGVSLWFVYGIMLHSWPIIISNFVTLPLVITILIMKIWEK